METVQGCCLPAGGGRLYHVLGAGRWWWGLLCTCAALGLLCSSQHGCTKVANWSADVKIDVKIPS